MKKKNVIFVMLIAFVFGVSLINAQPGQGSKRGGNCMLPELTESQEEQISELRTQHLNQTKILQAKLQEARAAHHTHMVSEGINQSEIDAQIDQITSLQNKLMKERAAHQQSVRNLLTDEQKAVFDTRKQGRRHMGKHANEPNHRKKYCGRDA